MAKMRVYELAKELNIDSKDIVDFLGNDIKSASGLEEAEAERVRARFAKKPDKSVGSSAASEKQAAEQKASESVVKKSDEKAANMEKAVEDKPEAPKKKKPVLLFRPENSSFQSKMQKQGQNNNRDRRNDDRRQNSRPNNASGNDNSMRQRTVIKPSVPTTAEMYKDYRKEEQKKPVMPKKPAAEPVVEEVREAVPAKETAAAQSVQITEKVSERPVVTEKTAEITANSQQVQESEGTRPAQRPQRNDDQRRRTPDNRPYEGRNDNRGNGDYRNNRQGQPYQGGQGQNRRPAGQGQSQGQRPTGNRDGRAPFQRTGDNRPAGRGQGRPVGNQSAAGSQSGFQKPADNRSVNKKNNVHEKTRNDRDKTGKKAENFKNLSKVPVKKQEDRREEEQIKMIILPETITIKDLAEKMKQKPADLIKKLFLQGKMMTVNTEIPYEEAEEIALEYNILCEQEVKVNVIEELLKEEEEDENLMKKRPPVVCVMGHVDHGKTSLLDAIRKTNVTAREAGGITQHIGAYMVECNGEKITFLDTPGHEAFTAMRMRGAQATDIAILVVAADDGVKPQTVEAINHAKAAGVEVIVAVNKIDKPAANVDRVKQEMTEYGLIAEDWGGSTVFVPVSAKTGEGIDSLLEMVLLVTEVKELKANPNREMRGIVIEAKLDKGRGPVATVLVQKGTMKVGDFISAGSFYGRVRAMLDADGGSIKAATPSTPVEILGLNGVPNAGEVCIGHKNEKSAREYADTFIAEHKKEMLAETKARLTMDSLFAEIKAGNIKELPIIVKADVQGSVEAVRSSLEKLSNDEVAVKVIHGGVGLINESDISLASASNAIVIGFNIKPDPQAKQLAESENVDLRLYRVIYQAIDDVEAAMKGMLAPVYEEKVLGHAEVRQTFKASGIGMIAGCYVLDGTFERGSQARITRGKDQIFDGNIASLKRFKDDVKEVREGYECGIVFEKFNDLVEGDIIEGYKMVQVERK